MDKALILSMKKCNWANLLTTFIHNNKLTNSLRKNGGVARHVQCISGRVFVNPGTLVQIWRKLPPHLEDHDLQGLLNEEPIRFKILDTVYVLWSVLKTMIEHMTSSKVMILTELTAHHKTHPSTKLPQNEREKRSKRMKQNKEKGSDLVSPSMILQCDYTAILLLSGRIKIHWENSH